MSRQPSKIVFVGNIPYGLSEEQISDIFSSAGRVVNFRLVYDRETGKPKGFGFAEYPDSDSAASAVRNLNDYEVMGRKLRVDFSNEGTDDDQPLLGGGGGSGLSGGQNGHSSVPMTSVPSGGGMPGPAAGLGTGSGPGSAPGPPGPGSGTGTVGLPPLPPGKDIPPGASATDDISRVLRTLPPTQLLDVLTQMKTLAANEPARATELLAQAPQLAYAVFQALLLMDLVSPEAIQAVVETAAQAVPTTAAAAAAAAAAGPGVPPAVAPMPVGAQQQQQQPPYGYQPELAVPQPPGVAPPHLAAPPVQAAAPAAGAPDDLIKQVLELPQAVVDQLPEAERTQLMALRMQFGGGAR